MAIIEIEIILNTDADRVWYEVNRPQLLLFVAWPMIHFAPLDPPDWPERWEEREYVVSMRLWGFFWIGDQVIAISRPTAREGTRYIRDYGRSASVSKWDHLIIVEPCGHRTRYVDRVEIDAGLFTPIVVAFARRFYAHRQRRWMALVRSGFEYDVS